MQEKIGENMQENAVCPITHSKRFHWPMQPLAMANATACIFFVSEAVCLTP